MDIITAIKSRRSVSQFENKAVSKKLIDDIITLSGYAPSSCNTQPWFFLVFHSEKSKKRLNYYIHKGYEKTEKDILRKYRFLGNVYTKLLKFFSNYGKFDNAPIYLLLFARPYDTPIFSQALKVSNYKPIINVAHESVKTSSSMAMQNLLLVAHSKGLGTRVKDGIKFLLNFEDLKKDLYREFKVPKNYELISGIQLGYPTKVALKRESPKKLPINKIRRHV